MTLDQLKTFYIVANAGSFTSAAVELNMDQSNISRKIISMETRLRTKLFTRKARGLILTPEGQALLEETKEVLNRIESMKNIVKNVHNDASGLLNISVLDGFYDYFILPHLHNFLKRYPDIQLMINKTDTVVSDLESSDMVVSVRPYIQNAHNMIQEFVTRLHSKLYASPAYLKEFGIPKRIEDLSNHRLLAHGPKNEPFSTVNWHLFAGVSSGNHREPYVQTGCFKTRLDLTEKGFGISALSAEMVKSNKNIVPVLEDDHEGGIIDFFYIYPTVHKNAIPVRRFGEFVHSIFR